VRPPGIDPRTRSRSLDSRVIFTLLLALGLPWPAGCSPEGPGPTGRGGEWLEAAGEVSCSHPLTHSPDGAWLAYWTQREPRDDRGPPRTLPGVVEWPSGASRVPGGLPVDVSLDPGSLCWSEVAGRLYVSGYGNTSFTEKLWFRLDLDVPGHLTAAGPPPGDCRANPDREWRWHEQLTHVPARERDLEIVHIEDDELALRLAGRELARHSTEELAASRIHVNRYAWSPDGDWLAYVVSENRWGLSAGQPRAYLIPRSGAAPTRLYRGAHALHWLGPDDLFICGRRSGPLNFDLLHWPIERMD